MGGESFFASVGTAIELKSMGLRFVGVVKTATRRYPMAWLSNVELQQRGERKGLVHVEKTVQPILLAYVWADRDRRYFISSCSSHSEGRADVRQRWRQMAEGDADAERVQLIVPTPQCCELYYEKCSAIDEHNRHR